MSAFNHVYNIKEYFYISPAAATEHQNKVCPAHNNVNSVRINKVRRNERMHGIVSGDRPAA